MRALMLGAALAAGLGLSACGSSDEKAEAPAPKKSLARQAVFYQGQEHVTSVAGGTVEAGPTSLLLKADAKVPSAGYTDPSFLPRIYAAAPPDGIYEVDVVATKPTNAAAQVETPIHIDGSWPGYNKARLKGVKFISGSNEVVAMLPAAP